MNEPQRRARSVWDAAAAALLIAVAILIASTFRDYGVTVDERHSAINGQYFLDWYASGFRDRTIIDEGNQRWYGSFFNAITAFFARRSPLAIYDTGHILIAITGLTGLFFAYRLARRLSSPLAGFLAALLLVLTPLYYGHSFVNPKDLPFAVLFLISIYCMIVAYDHLPSLPLKQVLVLGSVIGLAMAVRVGGVMLFGYLLVMVGCWIIARSRDQTSRGARELTRLIVRGVISCIAAATVAWTVMLIWWPYAQLSPILNPLRAIGSSARFTDFGATTLYQGKFVPSDSLPREYLLTWFSITLPEFYGVILGVGLIAVIIKPAFRTTDKTRDVDGESKLLFLLFAVSFPLLTAIITKPILYDANRHFLFVVPLLAVVAGITLAWLLTSGLPEWGRYATGFVVFVLGVLTIYDMRRLHPFEYIYFNRSFGGLPSALGRYETDYWGVSHREGVNWLIRNYRKGAPRGSIRVATTAAEFQTAYYLPGTTPETERFDNVRPSDDPDIVLSVTRWNAHLKHRGRVLHVVSRLGVPLLYVIEVNSQPGPKTTR